MRRLAFLSLLVGLLLVGLVSARTLALPPAQLTQTFTLNTDQEVSVGYNDATGEKAAYDSTEDSGRLGNYAIPPPGTGNGFWRFYLHFDLDALWACSTIDEVRLRIWLCCPRIPGGGGLDSGAYRVTAGGWTEAGLKDTTSWEWATLPAFQSPPEVTTAISDLPQWYSWDITALVQAWHDESVPNYGLMLSGYPEGGVEQAVGAWSRAGAYPDLTPRLEVTCSLFPPHTPTPTRSHRPRPPGVIPEPSTLALLSGGLVTLLGVLWVRMRQR